MLPGASSADRESVAARFQFTALPVNAADRPSDRSLRPVAPRYDKIAAWISSVGAGAALFSADTGVVARDVCLVDPRTDTVTIGPAPTTDANRYRPFTLEPSRDVSYSAPMGCLPADLNEDGWQDVVVYYWGRSPLVFLRMPSAVPSADSFVDRELVTPPQIWNTNAATIGDYDGDGHLDLVFGNYFKDKARVLDPTARQPEINMTDSLSNAHNGGRNRLYRFVSASTGAEPHVRFAEVPGVFDPVQAQAWTLALGTQDVDSDGRPDLYVANDFAPDRLLINTSAPGGRISFREARGMRHLTTPKSKVLGYDSFKGMGVAFADINRDGTPDILVSNITEPYALQESNFAWLSTERGRRFARSVHRGAAPYDDHSEPLGLARSGWSWDVKAADFNNDGTPEIMHATGFVRGSANRWANLQEAATANDLILGSARLWPQVKAGDDLSGRNPNTFFARTSDGRFVDIADTIGVGDRSPSRSFAVGDVDDDGRLDFVVANQWAQSALYHNLSRLAPHLGLRLRLPAGTCGAPERSRATTEPGSLDQPTRPAIGAIARVSMANGARLVQQLYPANGHGGVNAPELLFGLGSGRVKGPLSTELTWRDGCGRTHSKTMALTAGWHQILLRPDGTAQEA